MRIKKVTVSLEVQEKIFKKHNVKREQIECVFYDDPYFFKTRDKRYVAIGLAEEYITVVFDFNDGQATIVTAYRSSEWQKKLYRVKKWKK